MLVNYEPFKNWFDEQDSAVIINKMNQEVIFKASSADYSDDACKGVVSEHG